jgi:uncharacterized protein YbjQ (UPF0145 family)
VLIVTVPQIPGTYDLLGYVVGSGTTLEEAMTGLERDAAGVGGWGIVGMSIAIAEETTGTSWVVATGTAITQPR